MIRTGHPWLFDRALRAVPAGVAAGTIITLTYRGHALATGVVDPGSALRVRLLSTNTDETIDGDWVQARARSAATLRQRLTEQSTALRLIHGEPTERNAVSVEEVIKREYSEWMESEADDSQAE